jgi:hypothetical protein
MCYMFSPRFLLVTSPRADQPKKGEKTLTSQLDNRERLALLAISLIGMLTLLILIGPAPSMAAGKSCAPIVRKGDGDFYKSRVSIIQGSTSCEAARQLLWKALRWQLVVTRDGWECSARPSEIIFQSQKCIREAPGAGREVIRSSTPKKCPSCTATEK